jgi:hypothetical protein
MIALHKTGVLLLLPLAVAGCGAASSRQEVVRDRGQQVMPFDLDQTTHTFRATDTGGIESVTTKTSENKEQIPLIREHLRKEQRRFSRGDFSDPMATHGMTMPGLDVLRDRAASIRITYSERARGAQLTYATDSPTVREAIHEWFAAQLQDHGADATP